MTSDERIPSDAILIDGSCGEGGGQILRTSLALSLVTGKPFRIHRIRAGREKPGLLRQHLTAVSAAAEISGAEVTGAALSACELTFVPRKVRGGSYHFAVGTAGSATLVLQTVLPALSLAPAPSRLTLEGGTHNPFAPPWDFIARAFLPLLCQMGPEVTTRLDRYGFFPAGGGRMEVSVLPTTTLRPLTLSARGPVRHRRARALVASVPAHVAKREVASLQSHFGLREDECRIQVVHSPGPGNIVVVEVESPNLTEVITGFGQRGVRAEEVARRAGIELRRYLDADVPVGEHLADQLLVPLALAGGGQFHTVEPSSHTRTNVEVIKRFLDVDVLVEGVSESVYRIEIRGSR